MGVGKSLMHQGPDLGGQGQSKQETMESSYTIARVVGGDTGYERIPKEKKV